jgi:hypothetical protein
MKLEDAQQPKGVEDIIPSCSKISPSSVVITSDEFSWLMLSVTLITSGYLYSGNSK